LVAEKGAAERGDNLRTITAALMRLLARYGAAELEAAITEALARDVPHSNVVRKLSGPYHVRVRPHQSVPAPWQAASSRDRFRQRAAAATGDHRR
jgi:hypothetical protein